MQWPCVQGEKFAFWPVAKIRVRVESQKEASFFPVRGIPLHTVSDHRRASLQAKPQLQVCRELTPGRAVPAGLSLPKQNGETPEPDLGNASHHFTTEKTVSPSGEEQWWGVLGSKRNAQ